MKPIKIEEARQKICPYSIGAESMVKCAGNVCMAWKAIHGEARLEDHSGGREIIFDCAVKTQRLARREGPPGSLGFWIVDEVGHCARFAKDF